MAEYLLTKSEKLAWRIMTKGDPIRTDLSPNEIIDKADELILLAEQIKNERTRASMEK